MRTAIGETPRPDDGVNPLDLLCMSSGEQCPTRLAFKLRFIDQVDPTQLTDEQRENPKAAFDTAIRAHNELSQKLGMLGCLFGPDQAGECGIDISVEPQPRSLDVSANTWRILQDMSSRFGGHDWPIQKP